MSDQPITRMTSLSDGPTIRGSIEDIEKQQPLDSCSNERTSNGFSAALIKSWRSIQSAWQSAASRIRAKSSDDDMTKVRTLTQFTRGYPNLAAFQASSENFMLYRKFEYLQARVLLDKQDNLRLLEEELDEFDQCNEDSSVSRKPNEMTATAQTARNLLIGRIDDALSSYAASLGSAQQLMSFNKPTHHEHESVSAYLENHKPVKEPERGYIDWKDDVITLRPGREHAWLDRSIEAVLHGLRRPIPWVHQLFSSKETRQKNGKGDLFDDVTYYARKKIDFCATTLITVAILVLLVVPIWLLYHLVSSNAGVLSARGNAVCIGLLLVSTLLFSAVVSLFTKARRHEILAAAAAYCAVLVVFLGNVRTA